MTRPEHNRACPGCRNTISTTKLIEPPFRLVQCGNCNLVFLGNPPDENTLYEDYYAASNFSANDYCLNSAIPALAEMYAINTQRMQWIQSFQTQGRLLDLGCGRGYFLKTAQEHGFVASGIEISARAVDFARTQMKVDAQVKSLEEIQNASERFGVITLWHVLEHFHNPLHALQGVHALLTDKGWCFAEVPNWHSLKFMLGRNKWQGGNHPRYHRTFFTAQTLSRILLQSGFSGAQRLKLSYRLPDQQPLYWLAKRACNEFALDAFLTFAAWK